LAERPIEGDKKMRPNLNATKAINHQTRPRATTRRRFLSLVIFTIIFKFVSVGSALAADNGAFYLSKWGSSGAGIGEFSNPNGVAIDDDGYIYVVDTFNNRIVKHSPYRESDVVWGGLGSGNGQFNNPQGIAIDSSGSVFVVDAGNNRIQVFNSSGGFITKWGSLGTATGRFNNPYGVALRNHYVYVTDSENHRIQEFRYTREYVVTYVDAWGSQGTLAGMFKHPQGIAVDSDGNVYVADADNARIQKFIPGQPTPNQWGSYGQGNGQFSYPSGVAVDGNGAVYVADRGNSRFQKFTVNGSFLSKWGSAGTSAGQFIYPTSLAVHGSLIVVSDTGNDRVQKFACDNSNYSAQWGGPGSGAGQFNIRSDVPSGIAVDTKGCVYVTDAGNYRIQKFSSSGQYLWQVGGYGSNPSQFVAPVGIAVDSVDNVYVADSGNNRIQKFRSDGTYLTQWSTSYLSYPIGIATDSNDGVYVIVYPWDIVKYDSAGAGGQSVVAMSYTDPQGNQQSLIPRSVAVNIAKFDVTIYVASGFSSANKIVRFDSSQVGFPISLPAAYLALDELGIVYAVDDQSNLIRKLTSNGGVLDVWGGYGTGNGHFNGAGAAAVDRDGNVYVVDVLNNRIQKFSTVP
jgi:tripartite motif-containing protein 71